MPLPALNWRYVGSQSFVSGIANAHDAVYLLGTATTYANGSARAPGTGSAWTWNRDQPAGTTLAVYGVPPTNALTMKYILGGASASTGYTTASPDTAVANVVVAGMAQNAGAYSGTWTSTAPFTTGFFSQYWRTTRPFATVAYNTVFMWESQEACIIQYALSTSGVTSTVSMGALFDPLVYISNVTCQSDNRLYFLSTAGSAATASTTWLINVNADGNVIAGGSGSANINHCGWIMPDGSAFYGPYGMRNFACAPSANLYTSSGEVAVVPFSVISYALAQPNAHVGRSREFGIVKDTISGTVWSNAGTDLGYVVAGSSTVASDAIVLKV